jgi:putative ATP-binding cassette transporter
MNWLFQLVRRSRALLFLAVATGILSGLCTAASVAVIHLGLSRRGELDWLPWAFLALLILVPASRVYSQYALLQLGQRIVYDMRTELSRRILASPLARLEEVGTHRLMMALTGDIDVLTNALSLIPTLAVNLAVVVGCMIYMSFLTPMLFGVTLVTLVVGAVSYRLPMKKGGRLFRRSRETQDELFAHFQGMTQGTKELKLHSKRLTAFLGQIDQTSEELRDLNIQAQLLFTAAATWGWWLSFAVIGGILFLSTGANVATLTGFVLLLLYLRTPLQQFLDSLPAFTRGAISVRRLQELDRELEGHSERLGESGAAASPRWETLDLAGVAHAYRGEKGDEGFQLGPVDLTFRRGELVFLVGGNGSGKTTFAKILCGLYRPEAGEIRLDGKPVSAGDVDIYRRLFSVVFSDFYLFEKLLGFAQADLDQRATSLLEHLQLKHKLDVSKGTFSTTALSRGQRKRLALLTAYIEDRSFFIFDEWAADQDPVFKRIFYRELLPELRRRGKTVLAISHDDAYYDVADRILKLDYGRMVSFHEPGLVTSGGGSST